MASFKGFIRRSPPPRLRAYFAAQGVDAPADFDWTSEGRGTALARSVEALLSELPDAQQDALTSELELLSELADDTGMTGAEQVCAGSGISLEGFDGIEDVLLMLATQHPDMINKVQVQMSLLQRTGGRQWARYQFPKDGKPWALDDAGARASFLEDAVEILNLPAHRKREADWYHSVRMDPLSGQESQLTQATIYIEERARSELAFKDDTLERQTVQKVLEIGIACDPSQKSVEIYAKGGRKARQRYIQSFAEHFAQHSETPVQVPRRDVQLDVLRDNPTFETAPADGIQRVEVSSLSFRSSDGGFARVEKRGENETLYAFLDRRFGPASPLRASGWSILSATLRIHLAPKDGKRGRILTVTLSAPNTTSVPNKTEAERQFVHGLLERWQLLAPPPNDDDLFEVVE
ncbi:hypothetical protein [Pseudooceanicola sp. 200-1SW]|uniref:hypothetical protein n=1 Tax=Pseudooceanicola sp. 200-1SW TaxID=3425949 RepID=UPI003D7F6B6F